MSLTKRPCTRSTSSSPSSTSTSVPKNVTQIAQEMGIEAALESVPAEGIGGLSEGVTPLEMADAYATLANGGIHHDPTAISKVEFPDGKVDEIRRRRRRAGADRGRGLRSDEGPRGRDHLRHRRRLHLDRLLRRGRQDRHLRGRAPTPGSSATRRCSRPRSGSATRSRAKRPATAARPPARSGRATCRPPRKANARNSKCPKSCPNSPAYDSDHTCRASVRERRLRRRRIRKRRRGQGARRAKTTSRRRRSRSEPGSRNARILPGIAPPPTPPPRRPPPHRSAAASAPALSPERAGATPRSARSGSRRGRGRRRCGGPRCGRRGGRAAFRARCRRRRGARGCRRGRRRKGDVVVAGAEVVLVDAVVVGQLEPTRVAGRPMKTLIASSPIGIRRISSKPSFS